MNPKDLFKDVAEWNIASYTPSMAEDLDALHDILMEEFAGMHVYDMCKLMAKMLLMMQDRADQTGDLIAWALDDENPSLKLWAAAYAVGLSCTEGVSMRKKAKELGVKVATLSKRAKKFSEKYGLQSRNMKSAAASESYRQDKRTNHHRYQQQIKDAKNEYHQNHTDLGN